MQVSRCFRAVAGELCLTLMTSFGLIGALSPPPPVAIALVVLGVAGGAFKGSTHDACKEV